MYTHLITHTTPANTADFTDKGFAEFREVRDYIHLATAFICILSAALASGLTIGLLVSISRSMYIGMSINGRGGAIHPSMQRPIRRQHEQGPGSRLTYISCIRTQSIDPLELEIKERAGTEEEVRFISH